MMPVRMAGTFFLMLECGQCCLGGYSYLCEHLLQQMGDDSIIESMFCGLCFSEMRWETWSMLFVVHACITAIIQVVEMLPLN